MSSPKNASRARLGLALAATGFGAAVSAVLLLRHHGLDAGALAAAACDPTSSGCTEVAASSWSAVAGVPLAAIGLAFFVSVGALIALALLAGLEPASRPGRLALLLVGLALLVDVFLFGVQAFSIGAFCSLCIWTYGANVVALWSLWPAVRPGQRAPASGPAGDREPASAGAAGQREPASGAAVERLAVRAFWLATGIVVAAVLVVNDGLRERGEADEVDVSILGVRSKAGASEDPARPLPPLSAAGVAPQWRNPTFRQARVESVSLEGAPRKGPEGAAVTIVTFSDFLCPSCRRFALAYDQYSDGPTGPHVELYYRNYPLDPTCASHIPRMVHPGACRVALGAVCADRQGRFWDYHDRVYVSPPTDPDRSDVIGIAEEAGLDRARFAACLDDPGAQAALDFDISEAVRLQVTGTPTIFINGRRLQSSLNEFADAVLWELEKAGIEVPQD